ncbi:MAG: hypothetical protein HFJ58_03185 [Clostridia bacterium]|nr:hypothetical protein [Clostridia bacterium]
MPMVGIKSQAKIIADYELLQELHEKWRNSKTLTHTEPIDARLYDIVHSPNNTSTGIAMWNAEYCALLSSKDNNNPYDFIETVMGDMEEGDIVILFSKVDYEAAKKCAYHINAKKLKLILED